MSLLRSISKNSALLFFFALVTAGILAGTYKGTKEAIAAAERQAAEKALLEIIPAERIDNDLLLDTRPLPETARAQLNIRDDSPIHIARKNHRIIAVIVPAVAPDGYSGDIKLIAGINRDGTLAGVRVLNHRETPGLGDKIDLKKSDWITTFNGLSLTNPASAKWKVKKQGGAFDQFTGATITPQAVVRQVKNLLEFVDGNKAQLFNIDSANSNSVNNADKSS